MENATVQVNFVFPKKTVVSSWQDGRWTEGNYRICMQQSLFAVTAAFVYRSCPMSPLGFLQPSWQYRVLIRTQIWAPSHILKDESARMRQTAKAVEFQFLANFTVSAAKPISPHSPAARHPQPPRSQARVAPSPARNNFVRLSSWRAVHTAKQTLCFQTWCRMAPQKLFLGSELVLSICAVYICISVTSTHII